MVTDELGADELADCPAEHLNPYAKKHYLKLFTALEKSFDCAGFCKDSRYFLFSEVGRGPPEKTCKTVVLSVFEEYGYGFLAYLFFVGVVALVGFSASFSLVY